MTRFGASASAATNSPALPFALLVAVLLYNCATLGRVPAFLNEDDGIFASAAYQFWQTGKPGGPGYKDVVGLSTDMWAVGRTFAAIQGAFMHFFGVSIFAALLPSFLAGLGLLAATGALGRALWDAQTAWLASLLLAASGKFFEACRWARPDILLTFFFLLSLWLAASAPAGKPYRRLFLAGLVMGLSGDVHLNGFLIAPLPLLFWLLLRSEAWCVRWRAGLSFVGAGSLGALCWLALHYWPNPEAMLRQAAVYGGQTHGLRIAKLGLLGVLEAETHRYTDWFWAARGHRHLLEGLCVLAAGAWLLWREGRVGRAAVGVWIAFFLIGAAFMSNPFGWYLILIWPVFALWMARAFFAFPRRRVAQIVLLACFSAYLVNLALWYVKARQDVPLQARLPELRLLIPARAPVLASGGLWFAFWDRDYTGDYYFQFRDLETRVYPETGPTGWTEEQRKRGWRYIAAYGDLRRFLDPEVPLDEILASGPHRSRAAQIREARAFSLARCSVERRIPGYADSILVLRVHSDQTNTLRDSKK
ncbi:MAG: glycosyltransferase family 39 protein [Acidobacteria bacterium]|nr:glycosyltransferase family 39 protein [Acidobacteriota bacterium]